MNSDNQNTLSTLNNIMRDFAEYKRLTTSLAEGISKYIPEFHAELLDLAQLNIADRLDDLQTNNEDLSERLEGIENIDLDDLSDRLEAIERAEPEGVLSDHEDRLNALTDRIDDLESNNNHDPRLTELLEEYDLERGAEATELAEAHEDRITDLTDRLEKMEKIIETQNLTILALTTEILNIKNS